MDGRVADRLLSPETLDWNPRTSATTSLERVNCFCFHLFFLREKNCLYFSFFLRGSCVFPMRGSTLIRRILLWGGPFCYLAQIVRKLSPDGAWSPFSLSARHHRSWWRLVINFPAVRERGQGANERYVVQVTGSRKQRNTFPFHTERMTWTLPNCICSSLYELRSAQGIHSAHEIGAGRRYANGRPSAWMKPPVKLLGQSGSGAWAESITRSFHGTRTSI